MLVRLPQPYDFELSTARFDVYGLDRATRWRDGGIDRFFAGREVRIEAAPGGVDVTPDDETIEAQVLHFLGLPFDLDGFYGWAERDETLARLATGLAGFRPPLQVDPFEALVTSITAQQVSLQSAAGDPEPVHRAIRRRRGARATPSPRAGTGGARDRGRADRRRLLDPQGGVRRRARPQAISTWTSSRRCRTRR